MSVVTTEENISINTLLTYGCLSADTPLFAPNCTFFLYGHTFPQAIEIKLF